MLRRPARAVAALAEADAAGGQAAGFTAGATAGGCGCEPGLVLPEAMLTLGLAHLDLATAKGATGRLWRALATQQGGGGEEGGGSQEGERCLERARDALGRALQLCCLASSPNVQQRVCAAIAVVLGPEEPAAASRMISSAIGAGVRHQRQLLRSRAPSDAHGSVPAGAGLTDAEGEGAGGGASELAGGAGLAAPGAGPGGGACDPGMQLPHHLPPRLPRISPTPALHLLCTSPAPPLHLPCSSPAPPPQW